MDPSIQIPTTKALLYISDSTFHNNNGTGFHFQLYEVYNNVTYNVIIKNCSFERNVNPTGSGVIIAQIAAQVSTLSSTSGLEVLVQDTNFTNHTISEQMSNVQVLNAFTAVNLRHLKIINCKFAMNKRTALQALDSTLYFGGHVIFSGNNGTLGMKLNSDSSCPTLMFKLPTIMPREEVVSTLKMKL